MPSELSSRNPIISPSEVDGFHSSCKATPMVQKIVPATYNMSEVNHSAGKTHDDPLVVVGLGDVEPRDDTPETLRERPYQDERARLERRVALDVLHEDGHVVDVLRPRQLGQLERGIQGRTHAVHRCADEEGLNHDNCRRPLLEEAYCLSVGPLCPREGPTRKDGQLG